MKLSRKFVSDYVDLPEVDIKSIAEKMTSAGNEYDTAEKLIACTNLVVGKVLECAMHPDSDHLHVCKVDVGNEVLQIVCGAPNVREGLNVIVALAGAVLPLGTIKRGCIRGVESNGMLCSMAELGLEHKFLKEEDIEGICELNDDAPVGKDAIKYLELDDEVIDFELTSNRGDLLSVLGMAYELGAIYDKDVKDIDVSYNENDDNIEKELTLKVETIDAPLFLARKVRNVTIKESPLFIKNRLIASGIRPINNVVDISNYVMLETGQPLHYYDADRLGKVIGIRKAYDGERLVTLDSNERELNSNDIVIFNEEGSIGLAGIMGGLSTEVNEDTKNIVIEAAIFDPVLIRKTSKKVLRSEASNRFEKGLDPNRTYMAMERSLHLLEKYADAEVVGGMLEHNVLDMKDKNISIGFDNIDKVLGIDLSNEEILKCLDRLKFGYEVDGNVINITVPSRRIDVNIKEDIIHEVGRIYGIDNIKPKEMVLPLRRGRMDTTNRDIRRFLCDLGFNETLSYSLIRESEVHKYTNDSFNMIKLLDPMTEERSTLRYSLIPSLMSIYEYNTNRGNTDIKLFELGRGYYNRDDNYYEDRKLAVLLSGNYYEVLGKNNMVNFYTLKGIIERLLDYLGYNGRYYLLKEDLPRELHPGQAASIYMDNKKIGILGKVHPSVSKDDIYVMEINLSTLLCNRTSKMKYKEISKYPGMNLDVAFVLDNNVTSEDIMKTMKKAGGKLVNNIKVFDLYKGTNLGENKKSLAFKIYFEDPNRTLTLEEVTVIFNKIIDEVVNKYKATLRNS